MVSTPVRDMAIAYIDHEDISEGTESKRTDLEAQCDGRIDERGVLGDYADIARQKPNAVDRHQSVLTIPTERH